MSEWKNPHANQAQTAVGHTLVEGVIEEFMDNIGIPDTGLPSYGIRKVAHYAAMVARAQALGFDPNLLRLTPKETTSLQLELAAEAALSGVPVHLLEDRS